MLLRDKASLNAPYSHALCVVASIVASSLRNEWRRALRFVRIQQVKIQTFCALLTEMRGIMFCLFKDPTEASGIYLNEYCVAC